MYARGRGTTSELLILKIKTVSSKENKSSSSIEFIYSSHIHTINNKESAQVI